jgi:hypothetical protein
MKAAEFSFAFLEGRLRTFNFNYTVRRERQVYKVYIEFEFEFEFSMELEALSAYTHGGKECIVHVHADRSSFNSHEVGPSV